VNVLIKTVLLLSVLVSCANVKQIDRGRLSSKIMQLEPTPEESLFINEVKSYREAAAGGSSAVGGGCGCN
jgi:hypothetical protein